MKPLTARQQAILQALAAGSTFEVISKDMWLSFSVVKREVRKLCELYGAVNRVNLVYLAVSRGDLPRQQKAS